PVRWCRQPRPVPVQCGRSSRRQRRQRNNGGLRWSRNTCRFPHRRGTIGQSRCETHCCFCSLLIAVGSAQKQVSLCTRQRRTTKDENLWLPPGRGESIG